MTKPVSPRALRPGEVDIGRYAGTYGGYLPDPPPSWPQRIRAALGLAKKARKS